ncbi:MAG TPA: type II secretion system protein GspJ [Candidatus Omnitrophota bacterium]|nr:type II secretion system protein GspJ [Candidatus Omnitrophota bacterium]
MRRGKASGFTFIEIIVVTVIVMTLGAAIYATLSRGVRLWGRVAKDSGEWKADIWLEKMTGELRNAFYDPQWKFRGTKTELFFPSLDRLNTEKAQGTLPVYVCYTYDSKKKNLIAQTFPFEDILMKKIKSPTRLSVLDKVRSFDLRYYAYDAKVRTHRWETQWTQDCFPEAVKITVEFEPIKHRKWIRTVSIPTESPCAT